MGMDGMYDHILSPGKGIMKSERSNRKLEEEFGY
jgi:hypothetical protein